MDLIRWQAKYLVAGIAILPFAPLLYLQGRYTRYRIGVLPDPEGEPAGVAGAHERTSKLLVIGESTVAGLGSRTHENALGGQFARHLSEAIGRSVEWTSVGKSGVTARRTIIELVPRIPDRNFDYIMVALGGNDVLKLSSPRKWRRDMSELLSILRENSPNAVIFLANCPVIRLSPALPQPIKFLLWELSKLHDANIKDLTSRIDRVFYYHQPRDVPEGFFADGIHPSEKGYAEWSEAMIRFFNENYKW